MGWGAKMLLARAAAYASHPSQFSTLFDYETMQPLIAGPPFERALDELVAAQSGPENPQQRTPETARRALLAGEAAIAITWPSRATSDGNALPIAEGVRIDFAELPGSETVYNFAEKTWTPQRDRRSVDAHSVARHGRAAGIGGRQRAAPTRSGRHPGTAEWPGMEFAHLAVESCHHAVSPIAPEEPGPVDR